jgi:hypothetical protein
MPTLYICEYANQGRDTAGYTIQGVAQEPANTEQTVAIGGTSAQSNAFQSGTTLIRVHTDSICSIAIGTNPTAAATNKRMAANTTEYFGVRPGDKIAVITNT